MVYEKHSGYFHGRRIDNICKICFKEASLITATITLFKMKIQSIGKQTYFIVTLKSMKKDIATADDDNENKPRTTS